MEVESLVAGGTGGNELTGAERIGAVVDVALVVVEEGVGTAAAAN